MENPFVATTKLHPVSIRNRLLTLGVSSNGHHHSLAFCRQQLHHHQLNSVDLVCGSFSQRRINASGRQRTANSCKNLASRNVRVRLGSRSENEADAASLAIEARKNAVWGVFHNFRCAFCPNFTFSVSSQGCKTLQWTYGGESKVWICLPSILHHVSFLRFLQV